MTNKPKDLSAVTTGKIKVSYDLYFPEDAKPASDIFIDISGNNTIPGYNNGDKANYMRLAAHSGYTYIKFLPEGASTLASENLFNQNIRKNNEYVTVTTEIDITNKNIKASYGGTETEGLTIKNIEPTPSLYLNVQPDCGTPTVDTYLKIKNISAEYIADASEPVVEERVKFVTKSEKEGSDYAYGYTYTKKLTDNNGYTGCKWTITYGDSQSTNTEGSFATKVSGEGTVIVTGLIITTGQTKAKQPDINEENPTFKITAQLKAEE